MPGKYDPDGIKSNLHLGYKPTLPELKRFLTDEEWYQTENYKIISERSAKANQKK